MHPNAAGATQNAFLSNMSHEIRTPLNTIIGLNEMILRESSEETIRGYAEDIAGAARHLLSLVNDVLDLSKISAGKLKILPVPYTATAGIGTTVTMIQIRARDKGLQLKLDIAPDIPSVVRGDEIRIRQVLMNLLTNAVKYTERGSITLRCRTRKLDDTHIMLRFEVEDTGIGIKEEDLPKLFAAFERIEEERNRAIEGTGLGMAITQQLLTLMGGRLEVHSVYGKGSTFAFEIVQEVLDWTPLGDFAESFRKEREARQAHVQQAAFTAPAARILAVDDTPLNLKVLKALLKRTHIHVDTAASGEECLAAVQKTAYDVLLIDHRMPGLDGPATVQRLKSMHHASEHAPIIALTANAIAGVRDEYLRAGFDDYLAKPIESAKLEDMLLHYRPAEKVTRTKAPATGQPSKKAAAAPAAGELLSLPRGLENCGSLPDYLAALRLFAETLPQQKKEIQRFYEARDWKNYTIKVHAMKSSARILGALGIARMAEALEAAGDAGRTDDILRDTAPFLARLDDLQKELQPLAPAPTPMTESKPLSPEETAEAYDALREFAATYDYDTIQSLAEDLGGRAPAEGRETWDAIWQAAKKPDWERLAALLKEH